MYFPYHGVGHYLQITGLPGPGDDRSGGLKCRANGAAPATGGRPETGLTVILCFSQNSAAHRHSSNVQ